MRRLSISSQQNGAASIANVLMKIKTKCDIFEMIDFDAFIPAQIQSRVLCLLEAWVFNIRHVERTNQTIFFYVLLCSTYFIRIWIYLYMSVSIYMQDKILFWAEHEHKQRDEVHEIAIWKLSTPNWGRRFSPTFSIYARSLLRCGVYPLSSYIHASR